ncbi:class I SAM-dependent rRNA methyltransferase [Fulvivirgaceae bacterium PWU20]|uniref:Class I SAM-dependent rRNA methyltransferase n=1 Tax=Chryseosolibacter indicus TaxID=2782351 RepID=A0ABS5VQB4_9BACT|nr:class I SAM-dependent rRNA methyltransferase [Chryseosolibacter indicus]
MIHAKVFLKKGKEISIQRLHPWIFSGAIQRIESNAIEGGWVEVLDFKGTTLGFGHYQNGSIAVRILSFEIQPPEDDFYVKRFYAALLLRNASGLPSDVTNAYRFIHAEGDGLPGLIIDYYDGVVVIQAHSAGMHNDREKISEALQKVFGFHLKAIYYKSHGTLPGKMRDDNTEGYLHGMAVVPHIIFENNVKFYIDWEQGQKTGFFLDQRENRKLLGGFSKNKKVLNTFCYTGGFSIYALHAEASLVHSVDASQKAIELTEKNLELNGFDKSIHQCFAQDTFDYLKDKQDEYDVIVLDPPAFAKHRDARHQAVRGYQRLNTEAMKKIKQGGILFTFSCSQVVDRQLFYDTIVSAAIHAGRQIKVLHHLSQPADHPVSIFHPEGEYLKGLVLYVE